MRWIKGLVPTVIILLCALVLGCICYVAIWGAPSFVVQKVEQALLDKGIPVHMQTLKISLWPRAVVTLKNVELLDPEAPPETRLPVAMLHEADVGLNWKALIDGQVVPERLNVKGLDVKFPVDAEKPERIFSATGLNAELDLSKEGCYLKPSYTAESKKVTEACDAMNKYLGAMVTYDFKPNTEVVDSSMISQWVKVDDDMNVTFDDNAVKEYIQSLAAKYDTKGKERTFTSASGNTVTVSGGNYGWKIDQNAEYNALIANIQNAETVTREPNYSSRAASHEGNDVGNTYAEVNLTTQHMYYVKDGQIALETDVVTGNPNKGNDTPTGVYSLAYKAKDQTLRGTKKADGTYEYETPVKYWMPFNGGVGFHDASWQPTFGGSRYLTNGSHGCVNMPPEMAAKLFDLISAGTPVVVHN